MSRRPHRETCYRARAAAVSERTRTLVDAQWVLRDRIARATNTERLEDWMIIGGFFTTVTLTGYSTPQMARA